jgi:hypothetical protein
LLLQQQLCQQWHYLREDVRRVSAETARLRYACATLNHERGEQIGRGQTLVRDYS